MAAGVTFERISEVAAERRMPALVFNQFSFGRERKARTKVFQAGYIKSGPGRIEFSRIKLVARKQFGEQRTELLELTRGNRHPARIVGLRHAGWPLEGSSRIAVARS